MIWAGIYVANGNNKNDALKISLGFLLGVLWAYLTENFVGFFDQFKDLALFCVLFVFGGVAVIISSVWTKYIYTPSWLTGWAFSMLLLSRIPASEWIHTSVDIIISIIVGVFYVGIGVSEFQKFLMNRNAKK